MSENGMQELLLALLTQAAGSAAHPRPAVDPNLALLVGLLAGANGQFGGTSGAKGGVGRRHEARERLRAMELREYIRERYLPGKSHAAEGATAELTRWSLTRLRESMQREPLVRDLTAETFARFREWLLCQVQAEKFRAATANKHLRHLRAVAGYAIDERLLKRLPKLRRLDEQPLVEVRSWSVEDLLRLERHAATLKGTVAGVPAGVWWLAWLRVMNRIGCRIGALMACRREDFQSQNGVLFLRAETQKQRKDQRIQLPPESAAAVAELLGTHGGHELFPWDHDPPRPGWPRKWKCLMAHYQRRLLLPCGLPLPLGVKSRQSRRTVLTLVGEAGGDAQKLAGHSSARITAIYQDRKKMPICRDALKVAVPSSQLTLPF